MHKCNAKGSIMPFCHRRPTFSHPKPAFLSLPFLHFVSFIRRVRSFPLEEKFKSCRRKVEKYGRKATFPPGVFNFTPGGIQLFYGGEETFLRGGN